MESCTSFDVSIVVPSTIRAWLPIDSGRFAQHRDTPGNSLAHGNRSPLFSAELS